MAMRSGDEVGPERGHGHREDGLLTAAPDAQEHEDGDADREDEEGVTKAGLANEPPGNDHRARDEAEEDGSHELRLLVQQGLDEARQREHGDQDPDAKRQDEAPLHSREPAARPLQIEAQQVPQAERPGPDGGDEPLVDAQDERHRPTRDTGDKVSGTHREATRGVHEQLTGDAQARDDMDAKYRLAILGRLLAPSVRIGRRAVADAADLRFG